MKKSYLIKNKVYKFKVDCSVLSSRGRDLLEEKDVVVVMMVIAA